MSTINWASAQDGDWSTGANWELGSVPASTDNTEIVVPGVYAVTISSDVSAANLTMNATGGTLAESSAGSLTLSGDLSLYNGAVSLNGANSIGVVQLTGGLLAVGNGGALDNSLVLFDEGELLGTTTEALTASITFDGTPTIAAATGETLSLKGGEELNGFGASTLTFGAPGEAGTVLWEPTNFQLLSVSPESLDIRAGELVFGNFDEGLTALSSAWNSVDIEAGATLDLAGVPSSFSTLAGGGTLTGSTTSLVTISGGYFSGNLTGYLNLDITGNVHLAGDSTIGNIDIGNGASLAALTNDPGGLIDLDTRSGISLVAAASNAFFVNEGTLLQNGPEGSSVVTVPFLNYGIMRIASGSVTFTDGFSNAGVVEGRLTTSGGTTTWTPDPAENNFSGDGLSGILWRNTNGDAQLWNPKSGSESFTTQDLGIVNTSWQIAGTGAFTGASEAGILWRNANGDTELWNPNGSGGFTYENLGAVNTSWQIAGTGDFNGTGETGILWRNANGDPELWNPNGSGGFTDENLDAVNTSWQIAGTGDFSGDGQSGILWRSANGDTELWNPNGSGGFTYENLGLVNTSWQIAGTGDFSGDGQSGILWRNANGDTELWNPNGSGGFTYEKLGVVNTSWQIAGTGDFSGDGQSGILWHNTNGDTELWNPDGSGGFTYENLGVVGTTWSVHKIFA